ncbi:hypothetical protein F4813DRAFT_355061 [Daldinia decipiens]|uniref:uncharacterized protein n=1 Tax=Daldinia decipiens TaxID=326647 RepID=UPI0020C21376|nr:uncharacterized protein F4813DRAFT_355061 [Daldinia decipiens]KAI1658892.1 hypothetical protein F4813DRAFT_355061 [Daldinia decipiens]
MAYNRYPDDDDIYGVSDGSDVNDEEVYNAFNQLNLQNRGTSQRRDLDRPWRQPTQDHPPPPQPRTRDFGRQWRQSSQDNSSQGKQEPRDLSGSWRRPVQEDTSPPQPPQRDFGNQWRQRVKDNLSRGYKQQPRDLGGVWRRSGQEDTTQGAEPQEETTAGPSQNTGDEQPQPQPTSRLIQHGRSTPGYPRWRRTQDEINEMGRIERGGNSNRQPTIAVPITLRPRMQRVEEETKNRIQARGKWWMQSFETTSRYYVRDPAERQPVSQGEEHEPYDLMIVLRDAHKLQEPEDFVDAVLRELSNVGEYSRDRGAVDNPATAQKTVRRLHTNTTGWAFLEDFDLIMAELNKLQMELEASNRGNAADRLFTSIAEAYDWNVDELRKTGFHQEIMTYVGSTMMGRLRFMRDHYRKARGSDRTGPDFLDETSLTLSTRYFSAAVHSASLSDDVRAVEWFSNWAVHFPGRHNRELPTIQLHTDTIIGLFETVYTIKYENAVRLLADAGFAEDVDVIDSFLSYKSTVESTEPGRREEIADLQREYFRPYVRRLDDLLTKYPQTNGVLWQKYRTQPTNVYDARNRLVRHMDTMRAPTYIGIGRWCRHVPPPGINEVTNEGKNMLMELWTKGWYCLDHRPWIRCTSCGWKYSCAICTNPHSCPHCKTGFSCNWKGCGTKSDDRPDETTAQPTYQISMTTNPEGYQQHGRRITPKLRPLEDLDRPPQYRQFFPKGVHDIPQDGPIYAKNISKKFHAPKFFHPGGWDRRGRYPVRMYVIKSTTASSISLSRVKTPYLSWSN